MVFGPTLPTNVAKLVSTNTCHVTASLILFDDDTTLTFPIIQIFSHKVDLILIALSLVLHKETFSAEQGLASIANHCFFVNIIDFDYT